MAREIRRILAESELDEPAALELAARIGSWFADHEGGEAPEPRSYPGHPRRPLPPVHPRPGPGLEGSLIARRSLRPLGGPLPGLDVLARLLGLGHGVWAGQGRGPTPSAGGLQALELYPVVLAAGALEAGSYHYDRAGHALVRLRPEAGPPPAGEWIQGLESLGAPPLVLVLVGDCDRVEAKYGARGARFLLLEAGHLLQSLSLLAHGLGLAAIDCGGLREGPVARELRLPPSDAVLAALAVGTPPASSAAPGGAPPG